jgi:hypothetical protein
MARASQDHQPVAIAGAARTGRQGHRPETSTTRDLYHYTDSNGLLGIVTKKAMRATDVQFLNDGEELVYAAREISARLRSRAEELCPEGREETTDGTRWGRAERLRGIAAGVDGHADGRYAQVFVTCFCNHHDLLSQWRGYGRSGGFALGFDSAALASTAQEIGGRLERVLYGAEAVAPLIAEMEGLPPTGHPGASGYAYAQREVLPWLARVKNSAFKEENEWRVTVDRATDLFFRSGGNLGVVPYVCIGFAEEALRQVVIGPGPHPKLRRLGAEKLLQASGYKHVEVAESAIADSYRS